MKLALSFILGVILASGIAVYMVKRNSPPAESAKAVVPQAPAVVEPVAPAAIPEPEAKPAPVAPAPQPRTSASTRPAPARRPEPAVTTQPVQEPAPAPVAQAPAPAPVAQAPVAPANPPAKAELPPPPAPKPEPNKVTIPGGTLITVRLAQSLNSTDNKPGDTFAATLDQPLVIDGFVLAERGARAEGRVVTAEQAGRVKGVAALGVQLVRLTTSDGQKITLNTEPFERAGEKSTKSDAAKIGVGAALGAAIGAIAGGGKGAAIGAGAGGAAGTGTVLGTRGKPAELKVETRISFKIREPIQVTEAVR